ncbi:hypothetical protein HMPREF3195_01224 [Peptostreptococcus anaerobius]|uniref:Uncharacterized protein n=1 Tax=Peptostreptococcus anaerobius TaxID=1261 RepID=A0A135YR28_9FIRM|nr:hypothetical protein HMPREF3195_01224 [Peptostreptococcus anaerobius]
MGCQWHYDLSKRKTVKLLFKILKKTKILRVYYLFYIYYITSL